MGQGTESCGGYEIEYDPYDYNESEGFSVWHGRDGDYSVSKMSDSHIENAIAMCEDLSLSAGFSCESKKWDDWVEVFQSELFNRLKNGTSIKRKVTNKIKKSRVGEGKKVIKSVKNHTFTSAKQDMICHCGKEYRAKVADLNRGWTLSCGKRCAAIRRNYGRPAAQIKQSNPNGASKMHSPKELQSQIDKEAFIRTTSKVTGDNLFAVFENISKHDIVKRILNDEMYFSLEDRSIHIDNIEYDLSQHNEIMLNIVREATTVKEQLEVFVNQAVDEIIADYEVPYVS